jgi:hypothetical protein
MSITSDEKDGLAALDALIDQAQMMRDANLQMLAMIRAGTLHPKEPKKSKAFKIALSGNRTPINRLEGGHTTNRCTNNAKN